MSRYRRYSDEEGSARLRAPHPVPLPFLLAILPRGVVLVAPWKKPTGRGGELAGWQRDQLSTAHQRVMEAARAGRLPRLAWVGETLTPIAAPPEGWVERKLFDGMLIPC